ncbi:MAG: lipid-A-disaccharide synthase [Desulfosarcinaceae bacterium]|nr:lipid-A-disaccharide synthase [Desulfosarcinaceae bacterium]
MTTATVMIVAGEASGDAHGAKVVRAMQTQQTGLRFLGIGGEHLRAAGVAVRIDAHTLSVVGITEVITKLPKLLRAASEAKRLMVTERPALLILIDFPDFNLHLAAHAKRLGIPVLYFISPQIWAWRPGRVRKIKRLVNHMAVILPFEERFYHAHDVPVTYVGHPLMDDQPPATVRHADAGDLANPVISLLPGSRDREVEKHLPLLLGAAERLHQQYRGARFLVSCAPTIDASQVLRQVDQRNKQRPKLPLTVVCEDVRTLFARSTLSIAASGTVTLEATLCGTPTIIIYCISPLSYRLGRLLIQVEHIGLANLIAGRTIMPELIQADASPAKIAATADLLLKSPARLDKMRADLQMVKQLLGRGGASRRVADIALKILAQNAVIGAPC